MGSHKGSKKLKKWMINRELSWMYFNKRVQMEADNPDNPLLERAKFLAIVTSNLDEFIQVRYQGIVHQARRRKENKKIEGGITARQLLKRINKEILHLQNLQYLLYEGIRSELYLEGVQLYPIFTLTEDMQRREAEIFKEEIQPNLRPLSEQEILRQKQLHLFVKLYNPRKKNFRFVTFVLPSGLPRLYELSEDVSVHRFIRLEDIVCHYLHQLLPREKVMDAAIFRVLRNQNFPVEPSAQEDITAAVRNMLLRRRKGQVMRLEAEERMSEEMLNMLMLRFQLSAEQRYRVTGPLDLNKLMMNLYGLLQRSDLKYPIVAQRQIPELMAQDIFEVIAQKDVLLYHPYDSFEPVMHLLDVAAKDPNVRTIKQTLYRVSGNSPIVQALAEAADNGKQVTVFFEAYARFDEENNLFWGERLERAGCKVIFGLPNLKTHSKITLIERVESGALKRYLHLGTGNYHDGTAKSYTDFGLLTADGKLGEDACRLFEELEGGVPTSLHELIKAPEDLKSSILRFIAREKENALAGIPCGILAKMNSLSDKQVIRALYDASAAGVPIRLIVRGICCLLPDIPGISENIQVISIVGRHLEHARAFCFCNGGDKQVFLSSADWMSRNLDRRVELLFPVKDASLKQAVENVLLLQWNDNQKAQQEQRDGSYIRRDARSGRCVNAQEELLFHAEEIIGRCVERPCETIQEQSMQEG